MNAPAGFIFRFISKSWDYWTLVFIVVAMALLPYALFPFSKNRSILLITLLIVGHITKHNLGVRIGFMAAGFLIGVIIRVL